MTSNQQQNLPGSWQGVFDRLLQFFISVTLVIFVIPFIVLMFYSVPASDDFSKASLSFNGVPQSSALHVTWLYYTQWTPRWLTTFLQSYVMSHVNLVSAYGWLLLLIMVSNVAALWYFFRTFFQFSRSNALLVAAIFYSAWIVTLTNPEEELFWLTGASEYFLPIFTFLVLLSLLYRFKNKFWCYVLVAVLAVAVPAQHEIAGMLLCAAVLVGAIFMTIQRRPAAHWYLAFSLASLSQIALILAPGTRFRAAQEHRHLWDVAHLPKWFAHSFYHGLDWLSSSPVLLAACCIFLILQHERENNSGQERSPKWPAIVGLLGMFIVLAEYCMVETASGNWSPARVVAWFAFIFSLLFVCVILTGIPELNRVHFSLSTRLGVYILFAVSLLGSANFRAAVEDVRGPAPAWHKLAAAELHQKSGVVQFELPAHYPKLAMHQAVTSDPGCWVNECLANYLHASIVVAKDSSEECPH